MNKATVKKYRIFSLVTDTIYIFTVAKQGFLGNFGTGTVFKRFYKKDVCHKLRYACCDVKTSIMTSLFDLA